MLYSKSFKSFIPVVFCVFSLVLISTVPAHAQPDANIYPTGAGGLTVTLGHIETDSSVSLGTFTDRSVIITLEGGSDFSILPVTGDYSQGALSIGNAADTSVTLIFDNVDAAPGDNSTLNVPGHFVSFDRQPKHRS